jgi:hypothetical protein
MTAQADLRQPTLTKLVTAVDSASDPVDRLDAIRALTDAGSVVKRDTVAAARDQHASWAIIGSALRVSKRTVARTFGEARSVTPAADSAERAPHVRKPIGWAVTTPRGRTLLRVLPHS